MIPFSQQTNKQTNKPQSISSMEPGTSASNTPTAIQPVISGMVPEDETIQVSALVQYAAKKAGRKANLDFGQKGDFRGYLEANFAATPLLRNDATKAVQSLVDVAVCWSGPKCDVRVMTEHFMKCFPHLPAVLVV